MTTPAQPQARHARQRNTPAAAARNRAAAQAAKQPKPKAPPKPPPTMAQHYTAARGRTSQRTRRAVATRAAAFTPEGAAAYAVGRAESGSQAAGRIQLPTGDRRYQGVIVAEFLAAIVILAVVPVAEGGSPNAKAKGSMSPYDTTDLRQMVAVGLLYFILALLSSGNSGRLSAWFGGLVLVVLAMSKLAKGEFSAVVSNISGANASSSATDETTSA